MRFYLDTQSTIYIDSVLHKYASINQNLFSVLINSELWFSSPYDFNDPYDCNLSYDFSENSEEIIYNYFKHAETLIEKKESDYNLRLRAKLLNENLIQCELLSSGLQKSTLDKRGISCFSERDDILLMWSHYSDKHKGICLTFDFDHDKEFLTLPYKVSYPEIYPKVNPFINRGNETQFLLATKSKEWEYEKEVRVLKDEDVHTKFRGAIGFNPLALIEIKFGYKCLKEDIRTITTVIKDKYPHIKLFTSQLKKSEFGIEFIPIN